MTVTHKNKDLCVKEGEFRALLEQSAFASLKTSTHIAVGCSGGPDSMALTKLLAQWAVSKSITVHALIVDHDLRPESAQEAEEVKNILKEWDNVTPVILKWEGQKPDTRILESARNARYALMQAYCTQHDIQALCLAHHQDDQAETFLFRLAKGSGLDGLTGMKPSQALENSESTSAKITLYRPLLSLPKARLIATCKAHDIFYIEDPSNRMSEKYARARLRESMPALEREGLTAKRLYVTAKRLSRAQEALEKISAQVFKDALVVKDSDHISLKLPPLLKSPEEIGLRVILYAIALMRPEADYAPRMERIENLFNDLVSAEKFRTRTLGGLIFKRDDKRGLLLMTHEESN